MKIELTRRGDYRQRWRSEQVKEHGIRTPVAAQLSGAGIELPAARDLTMPQPTIC
jgi:hypothetical protein